MAPMNALAHGQTGLAVADMSPARSRSLYVWEPASAARRHADKSQRLHDELTHPRSAAGQLAIKLTLSPLAPEATPAGLR